MIGKVVSHYNIIEKLGGGGMGIVYKALDQNLDRFVALKFLPTFFSFEEETKQRFIREAKAASSLDHTNICTIHEIRQTDDNQLFIVMAYYDGETLKKKIENGQFELNEAINITIQILRGLQQAHNHGVIHRDIKPANIFITKDGIVKILDFGLAKIKGISRLTKEICTIGTLSYMSPEQVRGKEVDHRTDIWSLGVIFYEMLTGKLPFEGDYEASLMYAILNEDPIPITFMRNDILPEMEEVISKSLEKFPGNRWQSVEDFIDKLKQSIIEVRTTEKEKSIIVLPFENLSSDPEQDYFSDGLTEELITDLSHIKDLLVISRNSAMTYKDSRKKTKEIAGEVKVQYVLEGSVRKAGNNLRITAQLIDANNDSHIWADKFSGVLDDIFDIQEKVSHSIVDALKIKLLPEEKEHIAQRPIENIYAYEYYLRARQEAFHFSKSALDNAVQYLKNGLEIIGDNAAIYSGLGYVYFQYVNIGIAHEEYIDKAKEYSQKALKLDKNCTEAILNLALITYLSGNQKEYLKLLKKVYANKPDDPHVLIWLITEYTVIGRMEQCQSLISRLKKVDPLTSMVSNFMEVFQLVFEGKLNIEIHQILKWFTFEPNNPFALFFTSLVLVYCNHIEEAQKLINENANIEDHNVAIQISCILKHAIEKKPLMIEQILTSETLKTIQRDAQYSYFISGFLALAGMKELALEWLTHAVNQGFINYPFMNNYDPLFKNIRDDDIFKDLMKRVKYEWENFEV